MKIGFLAIIFCTALFTLNAQALNAFFLIHHNSGCDNASGVVSIHATGGNGNYTYLWSNGSTIDTAYNLPAGSHSVTVYSGTDSVVKTIQLDAFGVEHVISQNACNGGFGTIYLDNITATFPIQIQWFENNIPLNESAPYIDSLSVGNYHFELTDAEGCVDSGSVAIQASSPVMEVFLSDSTLCWYGTSQVWFTPGFTLLDGWGNEYNSTVDTFVYFNNMASSGIPEYGFDSLGCEASVSVMSTFVYLQGHPDPIPIYLVGDTLSLSIVPNLQPDPNYTYNWSYQGTQLASTSYSYLEIDSSGFYSVIATNVYGCVWSGTKQVNLLNLDHFNISEIKAFPNPSGMNNCWNVEWDNVSLNNQPYALFDLNGKIIQHGITGEKSIKIDVPASAGVYQLSLGENWIRLISTP